MDLWPDSLHVLSMLAMCYSDLSFVDTKSNYLMEDASKYLDDSYEALCVQGKYTDFFLSCTCA